MKTRKPRILIVKQVSWWDTEWCWYGSGPTRHPSDLNGQSRIATGLLSSVNQVTYSSRMWTTDWLLINSTDISGLSLFLYRDGCFPKITPYALGGPAENMSNFMSLASLLIGVNSHLIESDPGRKDKRGCLKLVAGLHPRSTVHRLLLLWLLLNQAKKSSQVLARLRFSSLHEVMPGTFTEAISFLL